MIFFDLTNAPASFQRYINKIFTKKLDMFVIVYLDGILIYTDDNGNRHVTAVRWFLKQLKKFLLYTLEEVSIPLGRDLIPQLYGVLKRHSHGGRKNRGSQAMT